MKTYVKGGQATGLKEDCLIVVAQTKETKGKSSNSSSSTQATEEVKNFLKAQLSGADKLPEFNETLFFRGAGLAGARHLLVVGLGTRTDDEALRELTATAVKTLSSEKVKSAALDTTSFNLTEGLSGGAIRALVEGAILADYKFDHLKSKKDGDKGKGKADTEFSFGVLCGDMKPKEAKTAHDEAVAIAEAVNFARYLGDMPANFMTPTHLAGEAQKKGKETSGLKVTVWDKSRIKKERMGGLLGVSLGSDQDPRFIIMEYKGAGASKQPICFVGKGLTFDCGGVSIKPSASMEEMKYDMCGGASVIATMWAIARMKLKVNVIGLVPSTENMINGSANKPGDVLTARNGKTFEVNNTDAEGRLILADALSYASELKPAFIADAATLTGAMVIALGNTHTGYYTRDEAFSEQIKDAAKRSGEAVWPMPLNDYHVADIKGSFGDISNISSFRGAGSATAAAFLEQFVAEGLTWAHFDIAGTAWNCGNRQSYQPKKGATGSIVRTFVELARS